MDEEKRGRGRPRPAATVERDELIFRTLHEQGPTGRQSLADMFGVNPNIVYLSLNRLRRAGRVEKVRQSKLHLWTVVDPS
jgi:Mn-dependent DtxR family transcriptional regulator